MADHSEEFLTQVGTDMQDKRAYKSDQSCNPVPVLTDSVEDNRKASGDDIQWAVLSNNEFCPVGKTVLSIPPAYYYMLKRNGNWYYCKTIVITDDLVKLPNSINVEAINEITNFWENEHLFIKHGLVHQLNMIWFGPPGTGKTATIRFMGGELIRRGGIVFNHNGSPPDFLAEGLAKFRTIEKSRPLIMVLEDIDTIIEQHGESSMLALIDGELKINNIVFLATTNHPERLSERLIRAARFDRHYKVGAASAEDRECYLRHRLQVENLDNDHALVAKMVADTEGMTIADLRNLIASVYCYKNKYEQEIARLKGMKKALTLREGSLGFAKNEKR